MARQQSRAMNLNLGSRLSSFWGLLSLGENGKSTYQEQKGPWNPTLFMVIGAALLVSSCDRDRDQQPNGSGVRAYVVEKGVAAVDGFVLEQDLATPTKTHLSIESMEVATSLSEFEHIARGQNPQTASPVATDPYLRFSTKTKS